MVMQISFTIQPALFISSTELNHPSLHVLDDTEMVLDWSKVELMLAKNRTTYGIAAIAHNVRKGAKFLTL